MNADFQSWAALAIVVAAILWLTVRSVRKGSPGGGCGSCGCEVKHKLKGKE